ncbi:hypothetical protein FLA_5638 [Filimonas lacunae]|nr:hypothetical protein FLA_5638 [Filimonas lacunae]
MLPMLLGSVSLFGTDILHNAFFEYFMIALAFAIGAWSLFHGWKKHHQSFLPLLLFSLGFTCLLAKQMLHEWHDWLLIPAVLFIITSHSVNYAKSKKKNSRSAKTLQEAPALQEVKVAAEKCVAC